MKKVLAFDFGASSGRAILGTYKNGSLALTEIHRFNNYPIENNGKLLWDIQYLFGEVLIGIKKALQNHELDSIGIDTWGVDFGMIDSEGKLLQFPRSYRDPYTQDAIEKAGQIIDLETLYKKTGNQLMEINTLFQLFMTKLKEPELFGKVKKIAFMPDLFAYLLTGNLFAERSIASTAQMVNANTGEWEKKILEAFQIPSTILPELVDAKHVVGYTKPELGLGKIKVINVCEHDTASAVVSVPNNQNFLFISCGTWSLIGTELLEPIITKEAYNYNLTNESGINRSTRFLKNLTGLWIIQELRRNFEEVGRTYTFAELAELANNAHEFQCWIDTDHPLFATPGPMDERIILYAKATNQTPPKTDGEFARCVYESLAMKYKLTFMEISSTVQSDFDTVNIVGGGSQAEILCQLVADATNTRVEAGPVEATAIGNIAVQLLAQGEFNDISEIRQWIKENCQTKYYFPAKDYNKWNAQFSRYQNIIKNKAVENLVEIYS